MAQAVTPEDPTTADQRDLRSTATWPGVTVVIPILNEERHLAAAVRGVIDQAYPGPLEILLALGPSVDDTDRVAEALAGRDSRITAVRNPTGSTPTALNRAIALARHDIIARLDAHAVFGADYLRSAVDLLLRTGADVVGGLMVPTGTSTTERAIGAAISSPFGVGRAVFRTGGREGPSDSVYLGVYRRSTLTEHGGFDETFAHAQDWELNYRIRTGGGQVWFSPGLSCEYRPRTTFRGLARQYYHYGRWRRVLTRRYPQTLTPRYLAPPVAAASMVVGMGLVITGRRAGWWVPLGYAGWVAVGTARACSGLPVSARLLLPAVFATMHWSWAVGFLTSPRRLADRVRTASSPAAQHMPRPAAGPQRRAG